MLDAIKEMWGSLGGRKTYIMGGIAVGSLICEMLGYSTFSPQYYEALGFGGLLTLRAGMKSKK